MRDRFSPEIIENMWRDVNYLSKPHDVMPGGGKWLEDQDKRRAWRLSLIDAFIMASETAPYDFRKPWYQQPRVARFLESEERRINKTWTESVGEVIGEGLRGFGNLLWWNAMYSGDVSSVWMQFTPNPFEK